MLLRSFSARLAAVGLPCVTLIACGSSSGEPIDHAQAALIAPRNTADAIRGVSEAIRFLEDEEWLRDASEDDEVDLDLDEDAEEVADFLREHVFIDDNLESESGDEVIYLLKPANLCGTGEDADEDCVRTLTEVPTRLRVTSPDEGDLDVAVLVGDERSNPVTFHVYDTLFGATIDFADAASAAERYARATDAEVDFTATRFEGVVRVEVEKNAERDYTARLRVLEDVRVEAAIDDGRIALSLDESDPTIELRANGTEHSLHAMLDLGAVSVELPFSIFGEEEYVTPTGEPAPARELAGTIGIVLAGLEGEGTFRADDDRLELDDLGLGDGPSYVALDGEHLVDIDLNAETGRHFSLAATEGEDGVLVEIDPSFDLSVKLALASIADDLDDVPSWTLDETLRFVLDGEAPAIRVRDEDETVEVVSGHLQITSAAHPESNVDATAGQCIAGGESEDDDAFPLESVAILACE